MTTTTNFFFFAFWLKYFGDFFSDIFLCPTFSLFCVVWQPWSILPFYHLWQFLAQIFTLHDYQTCRIWWGIVDKNGKNSTILTILCIMNGISTEIIWKKSEGKQALFIREGFISKNKESILCNFFHIFKALLWWQKRIQTQCPLYLFYASWAIGNCLVLFDSWLSKLYIFVYLINIYRCIHPFQQAFILEYRTKKNTWKSKVL